MVAFVLNQFPLGHMPVVAGAASRQLPAPAEPDPSAPSRFEPQDHPRSELVSDTDALNLVRAGRTRPSGLGSGQAVPEDLVAGYEPLGDRSELEWDRDYVTGPEAPGHGTGYAWPPGDRFPEGGTGVGEPVVLDPNTVLDAFGDGRSRVLYTESAPIGQRSLPPAHVRRTYRQYRVVRPLPVWQAVAAPWFAQPGGGIRYRATHSITELLALGHLLELTEEVRDAETSTVRIDRKRLAEGDADAPPSPGGGSAPGKIHDPASTTQEMTR